MTSFEILHDIASLEGTSFGDRAGEQVDDDCMISMLPSGHNKREDELGEFRDAGDGVKVRFAKSADSHNGEKKGKYDGEEVQGDGYVRAKGDVNADDTENKGEGKKDKDHAGGDEVVRWCVIRRVGSRCRIGPSF